jgi:hypothetical protein
VAIKPSAAPAAKGTMRRGRRTFFNKIFL